MIDVTDYTLDEVMVISISKEDFIQGTDKALPALIQIPEEFQSEENIYRQFVKALKEGKELPDCKIVFKLRVLTSCVDKFIRAHLNAKGPDENHLLSGAAFMMSKIALLEAK